MSKVTLDKIDKFFGNSHILHEISLEIADGEFVVLVGPSGCGKSTTLRIIAGLEEVSKGDVYIGSELVNDIEPKNRDIAMVFQNYALYPHMNVYNNMAFGLKLRKTPREKISGNVEVASGLLGITELLERKPKELSGGQRQRVAVGRAIVRQPKVFLFDEPLSNLDAKLRVQMRTEIKKLHNTLKTTMIYVTHDQVEAMTMGDRIVVMKDGYIMQDDSPINIFNRPASQFVAGFIGSPAMNFFMMNVTKSGSELTLDEGSFSLKAPESLAPHLAGYEGRAITLGIRPEHILVSDDNADFEAQLEVSELMGSESYYYMKTWKHSFTARVADTEVPEPGSKVFFRFREDKLHCFDGDDGHRLGD